MIAYRVSFSKDLVNCEGHRFRCLQGCFLIRRARSTERAIRAAQRRFERQSKIHDWKLHADVIELEAIEESAGPAQSFGKRTRRRMSRQARA